MKRLLLLTGLFFLLISISQAQPINDSCRNATFIPLSTICQLDTFNNIGATGDDTSTAPSPGCGFYKGSDIWLKFLVPSTGAIYFETTNITGNTQFAIYEGTCGNMTLAYCNQLDRERTYYNPSSIGDTIYVRFYRYNSTSTIEFALCAQEVAVPTNNDCSNAQLVSLSGTCQLDTASNRYATKEDISIAQSPSCGFFQGGDIWYKAVLSSKATLRVEVDGISDVNPQFAFYSGTCGNFQELDCAQLDGTRTIHEPSMVGDTIYVRIYDYNDKDGGDFTLCIFEPDIAPNNYCADAIFIPIDTVCVSDTFTDRYATADSSGTAPFPSCGFYRGGDVWFKAVMPNSGGIRIERNTVNGGNQQFALYSGTCGNFTELTCAQLDGDRTFVDSSLIGDTVYLRVYGYTSDEGGEFELCMWDPPVPENNNCAGAEYIPLTDTCNTIQRYNKYATAQELGVAPNPSCSFYKGGDVWFKTVVPPSGALRWEVDDTRVATTLYSGGCKNFQEELCKQLDFDATFLDSSLAGDTVHLRVFTYATEEGRDFDLCLYEPVIASNDNCAGAIYLAIDDSYRVGAACDSFQNQFATRQESGIAPNPSCGFFRGGDVWFKTVVPPNGRFIIKTDDLVQTAVYKGDCGSFTEIDCFQLDKNALLIDTSSIGDTVYIRAFSYASEEGKPFDLRLRSTGLPVNDNCADAIPLDSGISIYSNAGASRDSSGTAPNPSCGFFRGGDVWFTYDVPASGHIKVTKFDLGAGINPQVQFYTGTCGSMTRYQCLQLSNKTLQTTDTSLANQTIYIRVFNYTSVEGGNFALCAYDSVCPDLNTYYRSQGVCPCETFTPDSTQFLSTTDEYSEYYKAVDGTDSIIVYSFFEAPSHLVTVYDTVCNLSMYHFPDGDSMLIDSFVVDTSFALSQYGCDSTIITEVSTWPLNLSFDVVQICQGEDYIKPNGDTVFNLLSNLLDTTIVPNQYSCDSSVVTSVIVLPVDTTRWFFSVCPGIDYIFPDGDTVPGITSTYIDTSILTSQSSCDSLVITSLFMRPIYDTFINAYGCPGGSYVFPDGDTIFNLSIGITVDTSVLTSSVNCDSVVRTILRVYEPDEGINIVELCEGDPIVFPDGSSINRVLKDTVQRSLFTTKYGCDSVFITSVILQQIDTSVTAGNGWLEANNKIASAYQWLDCEDNFNPIPNETAFSLTKRPWTGYFAVAITQDGCTDTSGCHFLLGTGIEEADAGSVLSVFPNPVSDKLKIQSRNEFIINQITLYTYDRALVYSSEVGEKSAEIDMKDVSPGMYLLQIKTKEAEYFVRVVKE